MAIEQDMQINKGKNNKYSVEKGWRKLAQKYQPCTMTQKQNVGKSKRKVNNTKISAILKVRC